MPLSCLIRFRCSCWENRKPACVFPAKSASAHFKRAAGIYLEAELCNRRNGTEWDVRLFSGQCGSLTWPWSKSSFGIISRVSLRNHRGNRIRPGNYNPCCVWKYSKQVRDIWDDAPEHRALQCLHFSRWNSVRRVLVNYFKITPLK